MREPEFGYWDVTCSRVIALEQQPPKMSDSVGNHIVVVEKVYVILIIIYLVVNSNLSP